MGELVSLEGRRQARDRTVRSQPDLPSGRSGRGPRRRAAVFYFDLASPLTYLAAERVDRMLPTADWQPASSDALHAGVSSGARSAHDVVEQRAEALRLPLVWPEGPTPTGRAAMRIGAYAAEHGRGAAFGLAASRLAYCGGFHLDDPEVLAEAAGAAGIALAPALQAAGDVSRDGRIEASGRRLLARGAEHLPVVAVGGRLFCGEERVSEAAAYVRAGAPRVSALAGA